MMLLHVQQVSKSYQDRLILRDSSFHLSAGEKVGLVGLSGSGKSTLLRLVAGVEQPDTGDLLWLDAAARAACAYLPQELAWCPDVPLANHLQGVSVQTLSRCKVTADLLARPFGQLSGGEKTRAGLAKVLQEGLSVLLLDEPTNHLDVDGLTWLEQFLTGFGGAVLVVSHDRHFLDQVVHRVLELDDGCIREYRGNYSAYAQQKAAERQRQEETYARFVREKKRLEQALERKRQWAEKGQRQARRIGNDAPIAAKAFFGAASRRMMSGAKALETRLERLHAEKPETNPSLDAALGDVSTSGRHLAVAEDLGFHYPGEAWLFRNSRFFIERRDRLAIVGRNGSGKSTLVRLLLGEFMPTEGTLRVSPVRIGYLAQELETLRATDTLLDAIRRDQVQSDATNRVRDMLGHLLFRQDWIFKPVETLSGGEKVRLAFARILFDAPDFLVLDEPTNALDLASREAIEVALLAFAGTLVFVSHDRYLLHRLATKVLSVDAGSVHVTLGGYDEYLRWQARRRTPDDVGRAATSGATAERADGLNRRDRILMLEHRLAVLAQQLSVVVAEEEHDALTEEFIQIHREVSRLRSRRGR